MATDWLFYWMTQPSGLVLIGLAILVPFILWRLVLGRAFAAVGFLPPVVAYACAATGLLIVCFASAYLDFSGRVASGLLEEAQRWSIVPGWTIYSVVLYLIYVLPILGLVGVPLSALLLRTDNLTWVTIGVAIVVLWLALAVLSWAFPLNDWHRTHRFASLMGWLAELFPGVMTIGVPFLAGVYLTARRARREAIQTTA
jgi:hypothetical protein